MTPMLTSLHAFWRRTFLETEQRQGNHSVPEKRFAYAEQIAIWILALTATGKVLLLMSQNAPPGQDPVLIWLPQTHALGLAALLEILVLCILASPCITVPRKGQALLGLCCLFTGYRLNLYWQSIKVCSCLGQLPLWFPKIDKQYINELTLCMLGALWIAAVLLSVPKPEQHHSNVVVPAHEPA